MHPRLSWLVVMSVVALPGCSKPAPQYIGLPASTPLSETEATANLKRDADGIRQATLKNDYDRIADLTHSKLVNGIGGREKYIETLKETDRKLTVRLQEIRLGDPTKPTLSSGAYYAIYPYTLDVKWADGRTGHVPTFFVCASEDGGRKWRFLDGAGIAGNRAKLLQVLPAFPESLVVPDRQAIVED